MSNPYYHRFMESWYEKRGWYSFKKREICSLSTDWDFAFLSINMERRRIGDEGNRSTCVSGPLPRSVYFLIGYSGLYIVVSPRAFSSSVLPPLSVTPSPHHSFLISHFSDPVMSKGVEGGGSSAASALQRQRRGFREARRDPRTAVDPRTADVGAWSAVASAKEDCSGGAASRQGVTACLPGGRAWLPHGVGCPPLYSPFPPFTESSPSVSLLILLPMNCVCDAS